MRHLILMRHAEAGFVGPGQSDFDRPLTDRGVRDAHAQGRKIKGLGIIPDLTLCSPALRTTTTWACVQKGLGPDALSSDFTLKTPQKLYQAAPTTLLNAIHETDSAVDILLLLAHNPGIHELAMSLAHPVAGQEHSTQAIALKASCPPATMAIFSFPHATWRHVHHETVTLAELITV